ncbi:MAG: glutathione peroxidase [Candidatus Neomarinimicrobiota bacterium]|jgi:glutathione peroxidase
MKTSFYELSALSLQGKNVDMSEFKTKTVLIVNTASKCGFTPQFEGLEKMYKDYKDRGLVVLGFPSNQFANQEPGDEKSIEEGCVLNYGVSFPMFSKVDVNGPDTHPLYQFLKAELKGDIKWNFTKFLVDSEGKAIKRFSPMTKPAKIEKYLLKNKMI